MSRYVDIDKQVYCGIDGDYERYNIDPNAPSIDIVRCGECKHFKQGVRFNKPRYTDIENFCAYHMVFGWNANAFCSYGERIDDGNTV